MKLRRCMLALAGILSMWQWASAQESAAAVVPRLVNFSGKASDAAGKVISGPFGVTFGIYGEQTGGSPLWLETQNVQADSKGNFTAQLGATKAEGLPLDLFTSGEARWLGVRFNGEDEQPRILLLSVPYALKAADAQTLGGLPASAFMLAAPAVAVANGDSPASSSTASVSPAVSGTGNTDYLPLWTNSTGALGNSVLFQSGSGSTAKVGVNTSSPAVTLDVNGAENVHGALNMATTGAASASTGKNSQPLDFTASSYNSSTKAAVTQKLQWQAEPVSNNTASPAAALSLLYGSGTAAPAETGLKIAKNGVITFASGQTFPGAEGTGTVTSVGLTAPSSDFTVTSSPVKTAGTLNVAWNIAPTSGATANAIVKRDGTGSFSAGAVTASLGVTGYAGSGNAIYGQSNGSTTGSNGVEGWTTAGPGSGVVGINSSGAPGSLGIYGQGDTGVYGHGTSFGFATDSNVQQARTAGGWVKAMVYVQGLNAPYSITRCFNSTLFGAAATTPPCGFKLTEISSGDFDVDFGFQITDRFFLATPDWTSASCSAYAGADRYASSNTVGEVECASANSFVPFQGSVFVF